MRFRLAMVFGFALGVAGVSLAAEKGGAAETARDGDFHISASTEFYVLHKYSRLKSHKAFAVGPVDNWHAYYGMRSGSAAAKAAVDACNRKLRTDKSKELRTKKCVLFDVDGKRTGKASSIGIPFGTPAPGEDHPWQFGREWSATSPAKRGIVLMLHGCNGYFDDGWQMAWVNYYRAAGFRVIMPNSFADVRGTDTCGVAQDQARLDQQTRNLKLRIAQTLRTIAGIRQKYPDQALYIHGHSEGGWIAQALGQKLDGIIITGTVCGFGDSKAYLVAKGVPLLHIAGTRDYAFREATSAKALKRYCQAVTGAGKVTRVAIPGMDHYAAIWWPEVQAAVGKFLDVPVVKLGRPSSNGTTYPKLPQMEAERYQKARGHKAIAVDKSGGWSWSVEGGSKLDAEELALFGCDIRAGADAYLDAEHMHHCVLVDVDGKKLAE